VLAAFFRGLTTQTKIEIDIEKSWRNFRDRAQCSQLELHPKRPDAMHKSAL
jgi:hypothetical protein